MSCGIGGLFVAKVLVWVTTKVTMRVGKAIRSRYQTSLRGIGDGSRNARSGVAGKGGRVQADPGRQWELGGGRVVKVPDTCLVRGQARGS